jgi:hypothetical protein
MSRVGSRPTTRAKPWRCSKRPTLHDGSLPGARLWRCAAVASGGSLDRLRLEIETLKHDFRDVIVEGEYVPVGRELVRVRDLNGPILDDA